FSSRAGARGSETATPITLPTDPRMAVPFSSFSPILRSRSASSWDRATFNFSGSSGDMFHQLELRCCLIERALFTGLDYTLAQGLNHLVQLIVVQLGSNGLHPKLPWQEGGVELGELVWMRARHDSERSLATRYVRAWSDGLVPHVEEVGEHGVCKFVLRTSRPARPADSVAGLTEPSPPHCHENLEPLGESWPAVSVSAPRDFMLVVPRLGCVPPCSFSVGLTTPEKPARACQSFCNARLPSGSILPTL